MKRIRESAARLTIALMRSIARERPTSSFHLAAADEMEALLEEVLALRALIDAQTLASDPGSLRLRGTK